MMWSIKITSKRNLSNSKRDFIAELAGEEPLRVTAPYYFTLHDIIESKRYSILIIEGPKHAVGNLLIVIRSNLPRHFTIRDGQKF